MFAEMVKLKVRPGFTREEALDDARSTIARWSANRDLVRKHYLFGEDGCLYGLYLWKSREAALKGHDAEWQAHVTERVGARPEFAYFDVMMILDNEKGSVDEYPSPEPQEQA
ncbi:MAG: hypothetical protein JSW68_10030 [Burkholderiales bacterium]|nr:MAG: hypothetical protein JSW68_10030 [Burkholderiales bacterium]